MLDAISRALRSQLTMAASSPTSSHRLRLQCIYFDDLVAAVRQCHENFLLIHNSLTALNRQLSLRRSEPEAVRLIKTQQGLVQESALQLENAMREVLNAVEEHFAAEVKQPNSGSQDRLWTLTEEILSQPGRSGSALLASLAAVVAEERQSLEQFSQSYSLESDLTQFQLKNSSPSPLPAPGGQQLRQFLASAQRCHVKHFLRSTQLERESAALTEEVARLTAAHLQGLEQRHSAAAGQPKRAARSEAKADEAAAATAARGRREDWGHALEERLEVAALEAEARCLEGLRKRLQEEAEAALAAQEVADAQRGSVQSQRAAVRANQETIGRLSRRNRDARRRLGEARAEAQPLAASCASGLEAAADALLQCSVQLDAASGSPIGSPQQRANQKPASGGQSASLSAEAAVARLARQVVSENGGGRGAADFARLLASLRTRCQSMEGLLAADEREAGSSLALKQPLVQANREALRRSAEEERAMEAASRERKELPRVLQELLPARGAK